MRTAVAAIVSFYQDEQFVLTKRRDFDIWCLPGGMVEEGEVLGEAVHREVREETGLSIAPMQIAAVTDKPNWMGGTLLVVFAARIVHGTLSKSGPEVADAGFFDLNNLPTDTSREHMLYVRQFFGLDGKCIYHKYEKPNWNGTREELYHLRDMSGKTPAEFFSSFVEGNG